MRLDYTAHLRLHEMSMGNCTAVKDFTALAFMGHQTEKRL